MLDLWDRTEIRPLLLGMVRSATTDPVAGTMLRQLLEEGPLLAMATALNRRDARLRASLAGSQFIGLLVARFVIGVEPLASADRAVISGVGPTIQRYLVGESPGTSRRAPRLDARLARLGSDATRRRTPG